MRFRRPVVPGDQIRLEVVSVKTKGRFWWFHGTAFVDGDVAVAGDMMASLLDREDLLVRK
jgi:3-hydroxyacyl-[acyl-carrier-protein] dehydratase